jgi:hypothetical protein
MAVFVADPVVAHALALAPRMQLPADWEEMEAAGTGLLGASENASKRKTTPAAVRR